MLSLLAWESEGQEKGGLSSLFLISESPAKPPREHRSVFYVVAVGFVAVGFLFEANASVSVAGRQLANPLQDVPKVVEEWGNHQVPYGNIHCSYENEDYRSYSHRHFRPLHSVDGFVIPRPLACLFLGELA